MVIIPNEIIINTTINNKRIKSKMNAKIMPHPLCEYEYGIWVWKIIFNE